MTDTRGNESIANRMRNAGRTKQIFCSILLTLTTLYAGMIQGWMSPMTTKLRAGDSPLPPLSKDEISILASSPSYSGIVVGLSIAMLINRFGRKPGLICLAILGSIGGIIMVLAKTAWMLYIGRAISGAAGTFIMISPMFLSECINDSLRGTLMALCSFQINTGILVSYVVGKLLSYLAYNILMTALPVFVLLYTVWLPETPHYLVSKRRTKDAMKSLVWWRGGDREVARIELAAIKPPSERKIKISEALRTRQSKVALFVSVGCFLLQELCGIIIIINYSALIFDEIGNGPFSPDDSSIIVAVLITFATLGNSLLIDYMGRRPLLLFSIFFSTVSLGVLTVFIYMLKHGLDSNTLSWVPIVCIGSFVVSYGLGTAVVPAILMNEMSPTETKPLISGFVTTAVFASVYLVTQTFAFIDEHFGLYVCFLIPTVFNAIGLLFTWFLVPETKGKSLAQIGNELNRLSDDTSV